MKALRGLIVAFLFINISLEAAAQDDRAPGETNEIPCVHPHEITQTDPLVLHLVWKPANLSGLVGYNLQIATDPGFQNLIINIIISNTEYDAEFSMSGTYYVRMRIATVLKDFPGPFCNITQVYVWGE